LSRRQQAGKQATARKEATTSTTITAAAAIAYKTFWLAHSYLFLIPFCCSFDSNTRNVLFKSILDQNQKIRSSSALGQERKIIHYASYLSTRTVLTERGLTTKLLESTKK